MTFSEKTKALKDELVRRSKESWALNTEQGDADSIRFDRLNYGLSDLATISDREVRLTQNLSWDFDEKLIGFNGKSKIQFDNPEHLEKLVEILSKKSISAWSCNTEDKDKEAVRIDRAIIRVNEALKGIETTKKHIDEFNKSLIENDLGSFAIDSLKQEKAKTNTLSM